MIKTGIYGAGSEIAGHLIKLLLHHPDVDLRWLCSDSHNVGMPVSEIHPGLVGETDMNFVSVPAYASTDVIFLCADPQENRIFLNTVPDLPKEIRLIDLSGEFREDSFFGNPFVYGLPEMNRKALVRGATRAVLPSVGAYSVALPLLPLAKHLLLNGPVFAAIVGSSQLLCGQERCGTADNLISLVSCSESVGEEIAAALRELQTSFTSPVNVIPVAGTHTGGIMSVTEIDTGVALEEIFPFYKEFFSDHSFITVSDSEPTLKNVQGTNKAVIYLRKTGSRLIITTVMDDILKGAAGTAVHIMNLLFGLSEKTGLIL